MSCSSLILWGSLNEAHILWASSQWSSISGISANSCHQSGILSACPCQVTHLPYSSVGGSWEESLPLPSLVLLAGSWRKWSTSGSNSGGSPRSNSRKGSSAPSSSWAPGPHWGGLCSGEWTGLSSSKALWYLLFCPLNLLLWQLQFWDWVQVPGQPLVMDWLSHCILSSKVAMAARALWGLPLPQWGLFWWVSLLLLLGILLCDGKAAASSYSSGPLGGWLPYCLRWFFKEDTTSPANSSIHSSPYGGDSGNLWSLYTW